MLKSMLIIALLGLWLRSVRATSALSLIVAVALGAVVYVSSYRELSTVQTITNIWEVATAGGIAYMFGALLF